MGVKLRRRKNKDGTESLLLDIYVQGKRYYEFLKHIKLLKPNSQVERLKNKETLALAESIRNKKALELEASDHQIAVKYKSNVDFIKSRKGDLAHSRDVDPLQSQVLLSLYGVKLISGGVQTSS